jgi:hypothetical protein
VAILPFAVLVAVALWLGVSSLGSHVVVGAQAVPATVGVWALCALLLPRPLQLPSLEAVMLIVVAATAALVAVAGVRRRGGRGASAQHETHHAAASLTLEAQPAQRPG